MEVKKASDRHHKLPPGRTEANYPYALSDPLFQTQQLFLTSESVGPGKKASAPHFHRCIDEIIYITQGELYAYEGDDETILKSGDSIYFYANSGKKHYLENKSEKEATFLIIRKSTERSDVVF